MVFPIAGGTQSTGYEIENSLRFNDDDSAYLSRTVGTPTNEKIYTVSVWFKKGNTGINNTMIGSPPEGDRFLIGDKFEFFTNGSSSSYLRTNRLARDVSAFYHVVIAYDTTQSTAANRVKLYINGEQYTWDLSTTFPSQNDTNGKINKSGTTLEIGHGHSGYADGYMSDFNLIDGQALDSSYFGETNDEGVWIPKKYTGTYGNNGFFLEFKQTGTSANSSGMGADTSGNGNHFTANNLAAHDVTTDTPTNNFCTMNSLDRNVERDSIGDMTWQQGNLYVTSSEGADANRGTIWLKTSQGGKYYFEAYLNNTTNAAGGVGLSSEKDNEDTGASNQTGRGGEGLAPNIQPDGSLLYNDQDTNGWSQTFTKQDIIGVAVDLDNSVVKFAKNNNWQNGSGGTAAFGSAANAAASGLAEYISPFGGLVDDSALTFNFGQDSSFAGVATAQNNADDNGIGDFYYAPPSGHLAICSKNLKSDQTSNNIDDGSAHFQCKLYSGNNTNNTAITFDGPSNLQPDLVWGKSRTNAHYHDLRDTSRGLNNRIFTNYADSNPEDTKSASYVSFDSNGFTLGDDGGGSPANTVNTSSNNYVAWAWKANGGSTTSFNESGNNPGGTYQANTTSGFSIVTYTGTGGAGTVQHGLGVAPDLVFIKQRNSSGAWLTQHRSFSSFLGLSVNFINFINRSDSGGENDSTVFNGTLPTSSVFSVGTHNNSNANNSTYVAYVFAEKPGYSRIGGYIGNGNTDGQFIWCGFRPAFLLVKRTDTGKNWYIFDNKRKTFNVQDDLIAPNLADAESTDSGTYVDLLSNGFKLRQDFSHMNADSGKHIFWAFAEHPFISSKGVPGTAV